MRTHSTAILIALLALAGCDSAGADPDPTAGASAPTPQVPPSPKPAPPPPAPSPRTPPAGASGEPAAALPIAREAHPEEKRLRNIRQLTDGGENAEAYFSTDGSKLVFQSKRPPHLCDQIYVMDLDGGGLQLVSTGTGRTTCGYWIAPGDQRVLFSSTHESGELCPPVPDFSQGYVWPIYDGYDIYTARPDGSDLQLLVKSHGYDAEATMSPDGSRIVFTSMRDGDLDIYSMDADGSGVKRLTSTPGYDGGPFFSKDGTKICFRARHPEGDELADYKRLLADGLIRPSKLDIYVMDADGSNVKRVTDNGAANFCPFFSPDGQRLIFSSNVGDEKRREFDLYTVKIDGTDLERITFTPEFDGFPMFSPDGKRLVWCSNRHGRARGETNVFIAEWVE
jgi:Tol biopolymer transport system component